MNSKFVHTNGIRLHYIDHPGEGPTLIMMPGLTANGHFIDGVLAAGLAGTMQVLAVDLRGRGLSDHPDTGYTMSDHAKDVIGLLDALGIDKAIVGGHSFGALLSFYLAANYPNRVEKMVLIDAAAQMHPNTKEMLAPALNRLGKTSESFDAFLQKAKAAPYLTFWDPQMENFYRADVKENEDGSVTPRSKLEHMLEAINKAWDEPWMEYIDGVQHPAILLNGPDEYTLGAPLLPKENALATVAMMHNCVYQEIAGNHFTMLYGEGAQQIAKAIILFIKGQQTGGTTSNEQEAM